MANSEFKPILKLPFLTVHMGDIPVVAVSLILGGVIGYIVAKRN